MARSGRLNSGVEMFVSIRLFGRTSASGPPKSKNVCQPMNRRARARAAAQVDRVGLALAGAGRR